MAKIVSADQINRTGTMITPNNMRRMVMRFSLGLFISA
jgi:capsular polysaccharide biosynthesis protein